MVIDQDGISCNCGQKGCWERYASARALIERIKQRMADDNGIETVLVKRYVHMDDVKKALINGDKFALEMIRESAKYIGVGLANILKILDPEVIILGGSLGMLLDYYHDDLVKEVEIGLTKQKMKCKIVKSSLKNAVLKGGFELFSHYG